MEKEKLLVWIDERITDHKDKSEFIQNYGSPIDIVKLNYHLAAGSELKFLRLFIDDMKYFD